MIGFGGSRPTRRSNARVAERQTRWTDPVPQGVGVQVSTLATKPRSFFVVSSIGDLAIDPEEVDALLSFRAKQIIYAERFRASLVQEKRSIASQRSFAAETLLRACEFLDFDADRIQKMKRFADSESGTGFADAKLSEMFRLRSRCSLRST